MTRRPVRRIHAQDGLDPRTRSPPRSLPSLWSFRFVPAGRRDESALCARGVWGSDRSRLESGWPNVCGSSRSHPPRQRSERCRWPARAGHRQMRSRGRKVSGADRDEVLEHVEAALPAGRSAQAFVEPPTFAAKHVLDVDHARREVDDRAAEEAIGPEWCEIDLHALRLTVGLDMHRSGIQPCREA